MDLNQFSGLGYIIYVGNLMKASDGIDYLLTTDDVELTDREKAFLKEAAGILDQRLENLAKKNIER